ncbi:MAG: hypothetical protein ACK5Q5_22595 [Planctomycetaceae bacterium]
MTVGLLVLTCAAFVYTRVRESLEAEETLHAYRVVLDALTVYVRESNGRWPESWDELSRVAPTGSHGVFDWPADIPDISKRVHVRFDLTASDVAEMDSSRFTAVEQMGPNYGPDLARIEQLKETSGFAVTQEGKSRPSP